MNLQSFNLAADAVFSKTLSPLLSLLLRDVPRQAGGNRPVPELVLVEHVAVLKGFSVKASEIGVLVGGIVDQDAAGFVLSLDWCTRIECGELKLK